MNNIFGINFDRFAKRFERNIYHSAKGEIRKAVLWNHIQQHIPLDRQQGLRILDLGCGSAVFAEQLLERGHELVLCDISAEMLNQCKKRLADHESTDRVTYIHSPLQHLAQYVEGKFDIVLCHAVIEWLPEPEELLSTIDDFLEDGGYLSLMFYNRNSLILRNMQLGNWRRVKNNWLKGRGKKTLTPINPQDPQHIYNLLKNHHWYIIDKAGIRVFYDYVDRNVDRRNIDLLLELEQEYATQEPFCSIARYIHVVAKKTELD